MMKAQKYKLIEVPEELKDQIEFNIRQAEKELYKKLDFEISPE